MPESDGDDASASVGRRDSVSGERSVPELMRQLSDQTVTLVRQELDLAKAEVTEKGKRAGLGAGMFGGAGLVGLFALGALAACAILALTTAVDGWLAALIVAAGLGALAGALALFGKRNVKRGMPPVPEQTIESVKEDVQRTKVRAREGRG
jgi:membrane protein